MVDSSQGRTSSKDGGVHDQSFLDPEHPFPAHSGVVELDKNTEGFFSQVLLTKLNLGRMSTPSSGALSSSPPRSPGSFTCKHTLLRLVTPLDLPGSPTQPTKKIRRPGVAPTGIWKMKISQPTEKTKQDNRAVLEIPARAGRSGCPVIARLSGLWSVIMRTFPFSFS